MRFTLSKPFSYEDIKDLTEIEIDFDNAKGTVIVGADIEAEKRGIIAPFKQLDSRYCTLILARIARDPSDPARRFSYEALCQLPMYDFTQITQQVTLFLAAGASPETPQEKSSDEQLLN